MEKPYKKLISGVPHGVVAASRNSLWAGADHLLHVQGSWVTEEYRRFYYADIQSITLRRTNRRRNVNIALGILGLPQIPIALYIQASGGDFAGVAWFFAALFLLPMLYNSARGPTCVCHIATAVQNFEIRILRRVRKSERVIAMIRERIAAAQGTLTEEGIREGLARLDPTRGRPPAPPPSALP